MILAAGRAWTLVAGLAIGCSNTTGTQPPVSTGVVETISTEAAPGKPVSTTPVSKPEKTNSGSWCETGVPECDLYMKYTREKFEKQVGVPLSERLEKALQESCDAWKKATTKAGPEEIAKHCLPGLRVFLSDS